MGLQAPVLQQNLSRRTATGCIEPLPLEEGKAALLNVYGPLLLQQQQIANLPLKDYALLMKVNVQFSQPIFTFLMAAMGLNLQKSAKSTRPCWEYESSISGLHGKKIGLAFGKAVTRRMSLGPLIDCHRCVNLHASELHL